MNNSSEFKSLESLIKKETNYKIKQELVLKQINILENVQKEFIIKAQKAGYSLESYNVLAIMRNQFRAMKSLAELVNLPTVKYDNKLKEIELKIFGKNF